MFEHCGDWSEWSSPVKKTIQPEVTSIVCLAEMIKSKPEEDSILVAATSPGPQQGLDLGVISLLTQTLQDSQ